MASTQIHTNQARHNEKLAKKLLKTPFIDWVCTTTFYAALHYVEAKFTGIPQIVHTETCYENKQYEIKSEDKRISLHLFRELLIGKFFSDGVKARYRHLRTSSEAVRYLYAPINKIGSDYIDEPTVEKFLNKDLEDIKNAKPKASKKEPQSF